MEKPNLLEECECGHPLEEHDWGAYNNPETEWLPVCLVEGCKCENFTPQVTTSKLRRIKDGRH